MRHVDGTPVAWAARGVAAGAALGLWEAVLTPVSGYGIPAPYSAAVALFDALLGALVGLLLAAAAALLGRRFPRLRVPGFGAAFLLPSAGVALVFLADKVDVAAEFRGTPSTGPLAVFLLAATAALAVALRLLPGLVRTARPEASATAGFLLVGGWLAGGRWLTRWSVGSYTTGPGLALNLVLVLAFMVALLVQDRLLFRRPAGRRLSPVAAAVALTALATVAGLLAGAMVRPSAPKTPKPSRPAADNGRPNVVLVTVDTLRADRVSAYGYGRDTTPRLDALAAEGVLYRHTVSPSSWTLPAHASLFTGLLPSEHGAHHPPPRQEGEVVQGVRPATPLSTDHLLLAEILRGAGYRTGAVVANIGYLNPTFHFDQGFDHYDSRPRREIGYEPLASAFLRRCLPVLHDRITKPYRLAGEVVDAAQSWLDRYSGGPFFLFVNLMDPHNPYAPPPPYDRRYPGASPFIHEPVDAVLSGTRAPTATERRHFDALYDGEVAYADHEIGRLLDHLKALGVYGRTLVVVTADHGEFFGEHLLWHHGVGPFEPVHRVPLIVKPPTGDGGRVEERWIGLTEVFSLVLDQVGLPVPEPAASGVLAGPDPPVVSEQFRHDYLALRYGERFDRGYRALYRPPWKLVLTSDDTVSLFNLELDPEEERDVAALEPERAAELRSALEQVVRAAEAGTRQHDEPTDLDPETRRRLEALGYIN